MTNIPIRLLIYSIRGVVSQILQDPRVIYNSRETIIIKTPVHNVKIVKIILTVPSILSKLQRLLTPRE